MAQPTPRINPTIQFSHIDEAGHINQTAHFQDMCFQQWNFPGRRTAVQSMPSPKDAVHTVQAARMPRVIARSTVGQSKINVQQSNIDPSSQYLMPPGPRPYSSARNVDQIVDPITRLWRNDGPWNPHQMRNPTFSVSPNVIQYTQEDFSQYRKGSHSDIDNVSDSGYHTQPAHSVLSNEPGHGGQELPLDFMLQAKNMNVNVAPNTSHSMVRTVSDQRSISQHSSRSGGHKQQFPCPEPGCSVTSKCASELKRHMLKHNKNFICGEPDCKRAGKGFSTINDLERHKKSVHKIGIENSRSYQCAAAGCSNKTKIWPRLDNFKQHLERMHKDEDAVELIRRSEYHSQEAPSVQQSFSLDPALLAGMGDPNDSLFSTGGQAFSYQPSVSIHTSSFASSFSSPSQASPIATSVEGSFPQMSVPSSTRGRSNLPTDDPVMLSSDNLSNTSHKRRRSTKVSSTDTAIITTVQAAPCSARNHDTLPALQLSNGPQTKSEQQRQALEKLSKANIDIKDILLHVLGTQQQHQDGSHQNASFALSHDEKVHASQAIADFLKEKSRPIRSQRRSTQGSVSSMQHCEVEDCAFSGRPCDLKKHMKRHEKPYGCTYPKCHKRFGAKSDWKRHENSQHFQLEAFRCDYLNKTGKKCGHHCYRPKQFQKHLADQHYVTSNAQFETILKRCKIGKNCQGQYWCGFCREIQILKSKRNDAWDERFNHIAYHVEKEKKPIDEWLCVEENRTKKELHEEMDRNAFTDEVEMRADTGLNGGDNEPPVAHDDWSLLRDEALQRMTQDDPRKHKAMVDCLQPQQSAEKSSPTILRNCCQCKDGPVTYSLQVSCSSCPHTFCSRCPLSYADDNEI